MRASAVRAKVIDALEAITPDVKASTYDVFRSVSTVHDQVPSDRAFIVERSAPQEPAQDLIATVGAGPDPYRIRWIVQVFYVQSEYVQDRILDDGDLILDALRSLTNEAQIRTIEIAGSSDIEDDAIVVAAYDVTITYDRRAA